MARPIKSTTQIRVVNVLSVPNFCSRFSDFIRDFKQDVFERQTSPGSEVFSLLICLDANKFVFLRSAFLLTEMVCLKIWSKSRPKIAKRPAQRTGNADVTGSNPVEALICFRLLLSNCLNWKIYCDDHSSLSSTTAVQKWIISYILHIKATSCWRSSLKNVVALAPYFARKPVVASPNVDGCLRL